MISPKHSTGMPSGSLPISGSGHDTNFKVRRAMGIGNPHRHFLHHQQVAHLRGINGKRETTSVLRCCT